MSVNTSTITTQKHYPPQVLDDEEIYYPSTIIFDVEYKCLKQPLLAYNLIDGEFAEAEVKNGRVFSKALGLELVDTGETLRLFNPETNEFLLTIQELAAKERIAQNKIAQLENEIAELRKQND